MPSNDTLQSLLAELSDAGGSAVIAFGPDAPRDWSFTDLHDRAARTMRRLLAAGISAGEPVVLLGPNSPEWIAACVAILRAGAVATPLDVQLDDEPLARILTDSQPRLVFASDDQAERISRLDLAPAPRVVALLHTDQPEAWDHNAAADVHPPPQVAPDDPALLFYTSGTTGPPKGVPLSHRNISFQINTLIETRLATGRDRILLPLPLHHVYPFVFGMLTPLALRVPLVIPHGLTGAELARATRTGEVTAIVGVPRLYRALYEGIRSRFTARSAWRTALFDRLLALSDFVRRKLGWRIGKLLLRPVHKQLGPRVRIVASGGAALSPELARNLQSLGWDVATGYGLTETAPLLTLNLPDDANYESAGRPIPGVELRLDPDWRRTRATSNEDRPEPEHASDERGGEVLARGPNVFRGYRNLAEKTRAVLDDDGWFRTGDLGWFDDRGFLHLSGRASTLIVTESGTNVQPDQVEAIYEQDPAIAEVGVLARDNRLVAIVVPDRAELRRHNVKPPEGVRTALARQERRLASDQRITDFALTSASLPRTRLGKIRRHLLPQLYEKARHGESRPAPGPAPIHELSSEDQQLLESPPAREVWRWLGQRFADHHLTPDTSLRLDLGVDSLEWLNITMEISQRAGAELSEQTIGQVETVRDLLHTVTRQRDATAHGRGASPLAEPFEYISDAGRRWLRSHSPAVAAASDAGFELNRLLAKTLYRVHTVGLERAAATLENGPAILTPNHLSYLDAFVLAAALKQRWLRRTYWAGWTGIAFRGPWSRTFSRLARVLPVDRDRGVASSLAYGAAVLARDRHLVWFPEGERSPDGTLQPFQPGVGMLLQHFRVPAIPVHIHGTYAAWPRGRFWPTLHPVTVVFGKPLTPENLTAGAAEGAAHERIARNLRRRVAALAHDLST